MFPNLSKEKIIGIDIETYDPFLLDKGPGARRGEGYILGVSIGTADKGWYFGLNHIDTQNNVKRDKFTKWLGDLFNTPGIEWVGANIYYDLLWLRSELGLKVSKKSMCVDVQAIETCLCSPDNVKLNTLAKKYLNEEKDEDWLYEIATKIGVITRDEFLEHKTKRESGQNAKTIGNKVKSSLYLMTYTDVQAYAETDACLPVRIYEKQKPLIVEQKAEKVVNLESRLIPALVEMFYLGVKFDVEKAKQRSQKINETASKKKEIINKLYGREINTNSPDEVMEIALDRGWDIVLTEKSGKLTMSEDYLKNQNDEVANAIIEINHLTDIKSKFFDGLVNKAPLGRLHTSYFATKQEFGGTRTGRLSSANPNLQNISTENEDPLTMVRDLFLPDTGVWGCIDYSQQEYRLLVHYCYALKGMYKNYWKIKDVESAIRSTEKAYNAYIEDPATDFHKYVQDNINNVFAEKGISYRLTERKPVKNINFMGVYGGGKTKTKEMLGLDSKTAGLVYDTYHEASPYIKAIQVVTDTEAQKRGYISTISGRRSRFELWEPQEFPGQDEKGNYKFWKAYPLPEALEKYKGKPLKRSGTYKALNYLIQGSGAEVMKEAIVNLYEKYDLIPHLTVHDELNFSLPDNEKDRAEMSKIILDTMQNSEMFHISIPMLCDIEMGTNWHDIK